MSIAERFAANLKRCRQRAGITQAQLACSTELDAATISLLSSASGRRDWTASSNSPGYSTAGQTSCWRGSRRR